MYCTYNCSIDSCFIPILRKNVICKIYQITASEFEKFKEANVIASKIWFIRPGFLHYRFRNVRCHLTKYLSMNNYKPESFSPSKYVPSHADIIIAIPHGYVFTYNQIERRFSDLYSVKKY